MIDGKMMKCIYLFIYLLLIFLWPLLQSVRILSEDSSEALQDLSASKDS